MRSRKRGRTEQKEPAADAHYLEEDEEADEEEDKETDEDEEEAGGIQLADMDLNEDNDDDEDEEDEDDDDEDGNLEDDRSEDNQSSCIIIEPGQATRLQSKWIAAMSEGKSDEVAQRFKR